MKKFFAVALFSLALITSQAYANLSSELPAHEKNTGKKTVLAFTPIQFALGKDNLKFQVKDVDDWNGEYTVCFNRDENGKVCGYYAIGSKGEIAPFGVYGITTDNQVVLTDIAKNNDNKSEFEFLNFSTIKKTVEEAKLAKFARFGTYGLAFVGALTIAKNIKNSIAKAKDNKIKLEEEKEEQA